MRQLAKRFITDERGQDVIEYGLLAAFIATVGILTWQSIGTELANKYTSWDGGVQVLSTCTPDPGGGGC